VSVLAGTVDAQSERLNIAADKSRAGASVVLKRQGSGLFNDFLHMADFILDLPGHFFSGTFAFQVGIVRHMTDFLLNRALRFVDHACDLVLSTRSPFVFSSDFFQFRYKMADRQNSDIRHQRHNSKKDECGCLSPIGHLQVNLPVLESRPG
jgi:hypothetical protein